MSETRVEDIYREVKSRASGFGIKPGERLNEGALAAELGVSRTPLREALNRLVAEQLIVFRPGFGFFCRALDPQDMMNLYELRLVTELAAVRLAVKRASDVELEAFAAEERTRGATLAGLTIAQAVARDEAFHMRIAHLSGNAEISRLLDNINARTRLIRWVRVGQRIRDSKEEHRRIVNALVTRNVERAETEISAHIEQRRDQVLAAVKEGISSIYLGETGALTAQILEDI